MTDLLTRFILQALTGDLKTSSYPKDFQDLRIRISFGMGAPAKVPWIAFISGEMAVSKGFYPVYLFYKEEKILILSYGVSETEEYGKTWPVEVMNSTSTISSYFDHKVPRYGESFVFKAYKTDIQNGVVRFLDPVNGKELTATDINSDLDTILDYYRNAISLPQVAITPEISQGLFYMEKQLEDFLIMNWEQSELGKKYNLLVEDGELKSQQFKTDIGPIDILAKDKETGSYVVIELKKNQTSDDTAGQLTRYMGWVKKHLNDNNVKGIIISGQSDKKLVYALDMIPNTELFVYEVDFKLTKISDV